MLKAVTIDDLKDAIKGHKRYDTEKIMRAYEVAAKLHEGQKRQSGEPYISHPLAVAVIVCDILADTDSVCAALLHDVVEDCGDKIALDDIRREFGDDVADIVDGLTKLLHIKFEDKQEESIENLRKMFLAMSKDLRVIFVKLADRLHNMRTIEAKSADRRIAISTETLRVYAPLAHRLGLHRVKQELEDLAIRNLEPDVYAEIEADIARKYGKTDNFLVLMRKRISDFLNEKRLECEVVGRVKTIYSLYKKMISQGKTLDEIYDFYALRIIVNTKDECYLALGYIHELFKVVPGRYKDYISTPKPNMYMSVHTTVIGEQGIPFEVQIRTRQMHRIAEYGLAAHWKYKSGTDAERSVDEKLYWVRMLLENGSDVSDPDEFFLPLKVDLFEEEIFVFTPKGDIISLPNGSTPIDFAYAIHSAVGNKLVGAKVNGRIIPIDSKLKTGQIVEIITSGSTKGPSRDWLTFVRTGQARSKIRQFFKKERRTENIAVGKSEVERELRRVNKGLTDAQRTEVVKTVGARLGFSEIDDFYNNIGYGGISVSGILPKLKDEIERLYGTVEPKNIEHQSAPKASVSRDDKSHGVVIDSVTNCAVKFSKCCNPLPGDRIIGFITRGHGVTVHRYDCANVQKSLLGGGDPDRWISASWAGNTEQQGAYEASLKIFSQKSPTIFSDISAVFTSMNINVVSFVKKETEEVTLIDVTLKCRNVEQLHAIMAALKKLKWIITIKRGAGFN